MIPFTFVKPLAGFLLAFLLLWGVGSLPAPAEAGSGDHEAIVIRSSPSTSPASTLVAAWDDEDEEEDEDDEEDEDEEEDERSERREREVRRDRGTEAFRDREVERSRGREAEVPPRGRSARKPAKSSFGPRPSVRKRSTA